MATDASRQQYLMDLQRAAMQRARSAPARGVANATAKQAALRNARSGPRAVGLEGRAGTLQALTQMLARNRANAPKRTAGRKVPPAVGLRRRFPGAPAGMHPSEINRNFGGANNGGGTTAPRAMTPARRQYRATHGRNYRQRHPWREQRDLQKPRTLY